MTEKKNAVTERDDGNADVGRSEKGQFVPGHTGFGGGRPKGSRNKLGEKFIDDMYADWKENGVKAIKDVREQKPDAYLKVVASILPRELNVNVNQFDEMSDAELIQRIRELDAAVRPFLASAGAGGTAEGTGKATTH